MRWASGASPRRNALACPTETASRLNASRSGRTKCVRGGRKPQTIQSLFTGIVQGKATIQRISSPTSKTMDWGDGDKAYSLRTFTVAFPPSSEHGDMESVQIGASIALNGTCLTVTETELEGNTANFDVIDETLRRTNLGSLREGCSVNFERSARVGDEIGGHTVSGHVQTTASISRLETTDGSTRMDFELSDTSWKKYILQKGFVSVDGCSLTVGETSDTGFCVYLIPETLRVTVLGEKGVGDMVNIEIDTQTQAIVDTVERVLNERISHGE
jgi:riboflavin synthase